MKMYMQCQRQPEALSNTHITSEQRRIYVRSGLYYICICLYHFPKNLDRTTTFNSVSIKNTHTEPQKYIIFPTKQIIFMARLHLPYDEYPNYRTMSKLPFPCGLRRETLRSSYGFTGIVASTILFNSAQ